MIAVPSPISAGRLELGGLGVASAEPLRADDATDLRGAVSPSSAGGSRSSSRSWRAVAVALEGKVRPVGEPVPYCMTAAIPVAKDVAELEKRSLRATISGTAGDRPSEAPATATSTTPRARRLRCTVSRSSWSNTRSLAHEQGEDQRRDFRISSARRRRRCHSSTSHTRDSSVASYDAPGIQRSPRRHAAGHSFVS